MLAASRTFLNAEEYFVASRTGTVVRIRRKRSLAREIIGVLP